MTDTRKAGTLILENLAMFNEAVVLYENVIHVEILEELDNVIQHWAKESTWESQTIWHTDMGSPVWVAPSGWNASGENNEGSAKAWFALWYLDEDATNSYIAADLCGVGQAEMGFWFEAHHPTFGGKTLWNAFAKTIPNDMAKKIAEFGFTDQGKGTYFLPVKLQHKEMASAWDNEDYAECFKPIVSALETLKSSQSVFDDLLAKAKAYAMFNKEKSASEALTQG